MSTAKTGHTFPVVIQLSPRTIRIGFVGDAHPIFTLKSEDDHVSKTTARVNGADSVSPYLDHTGAEVPEAVSKIHRQGALDNMSHQWFYHSDMLHQDLEYFEMRMHRILQHALIDKMMINTDQTQVFIPEPHYFPELLKRSLTALLQQHFQVESVLFLPEALMTCIGAGARTALVIDVNWNEACTVPICDLRTIDNAVGVTERAGKWLHYQAVNAISADFDFRAVENLIQKSFFAGQTTAETNFQITGNGSVLVEIPNSIRSSLVMDLISGTAKDDYNDCSISESISRDVIPRLTIDSRAQICENLIITGDGIDHIPQFKDELARALRGLFPNYKFRQIKTLGAWAGISLYISTISSTDLAKLNGVKN